MDSAKPAGLSAGLTICEPEESSDNALFSSFVEVSRLVAAVIADMFVLITILLTLSLSDPLRGVLLSRHPCRVADFYYGHPPVSRLAVCGRQAPLSFDK